MEFRHGLIAFVLMAASVASASDDNIVPLQMTADGKLYFVPDELSYFAPVRDAGGKVVRLDYFDGGDAPAQPMPRLDGAVAAAP